MCCAAGLAAFNYIQKNGLLDEVESKGALFERLVADHPKVVEVRRCGLLLAVELGSSEAYFKLLDIFIEEGILSDCFLFCESAFRISPPLTITTEQIEDCCRIIRSCLDRL